MRRLKEGEPAVAFQINDHLDNRIDLEAYRGQKVLLSLFRGPSCPFCNQRIDELIRNYYDIQSYDIQIIAVFSATSERISEYAGRQIAPFPLVPDPHGKLYKQYGVKTKEEGIVERAGKVLSKYFSKVSGCAEPCMPADFLINEDQTIFKAYYGDDFGDHIPIDQIIKWGEMLTDHSSFRETAGLDKAAINEW